VTHFLHLEIGSFLFASSYVECHLGESRYTSSGLRFATGKDWIPERGPGSFGPFDKLRAGLRFAAGKDWIPDRGPGPSLRYGKILATNDANQHKVKLKIKMQISKLHSKLKIC